MPRISRTRRLAYAGIATVLLFALTELTIVTFDVAPLRAPPLVVWNAVKDQDLEGSEGEFRFHPKWLWEPRPGAMVHGAPINEDGYRGPRYPVERTSGRLRIATLGDSSTYGFGLEEEKGFSRQLEQRLRADGVDAEVLNFGVIGYTLEQGWELYQGRVREYRPDVVILAFGCINDSVRPSGGVADQPKIEHLQDPVYAARQFLQRYASFRMLELQLRRLSRGGDEELAKDRVSHRVPLFRFKALLREFRDLTAKDGATLLLVSPPRRLEVEYNQMVLLDFTAAIEESAAELDVPLVDVRAALRQRDLDRSGGVPPDPSQLDKSPYFLDPYHPSAAGHAIYAAELAAALRRHGVIR